MIGEELSTNGCILIFEAICFGSTSKSQRKMEGMTFGIIISRRFSIFPCEVSNNECLQISISIMIQRITLRFLSLSIFIESIASSPSHSNSSMTNRKEVQRMIVETQELSKSDESVTKTTREKRVLSGNERWHRRKVTDRGSQWLRWSERDMTENQLWG